MDRSTHPTQNMPTSIQLVTSSDNNFAIGLAGTFKSALTNLAADSSVDLWVLDGGITDENKAEISRHLSDPRLTLHFVSVDRKLVSQFVISHHVTDATYYRLLTPEILSRDIGKFIYLDSDLLIRGDLTKLWNTPFDGAPCVAIQDSGAPFVDSTQLIEQQPSLRGCIANANPIPNYRELGLHPHAPYLNGGVMMIDLDLWRREQLAEKMLKVLSDHREHVTYWDQYALNVVLSQRWKQADHRWNQIAYPLRFSSHENTIFSKEAFDLYRNDPYISHFTYRKPWQAECIHPRSEEFYQYLEGSIWADTKPVWQEYEPAPGVVHVPPKKPKPYYRRKFRELRDYVRQQIRSVRKSAQSLFRGAA